MEYIYIYIYAGWKWENLMIFAGILNMHVQSIVQGLGWGGRYSLEGNKWLVIGEVVNLAHQTLCQ